MAEKGDPEDDPGFRGKGGDWYTGDSAFETGYGSSQSSLELRTRIQAEELEALNKSLKEKDQVIKLLKEELSTRSNSAQTPEATVLKKELENDKSEKYAKSGAQSKEGSGSLRKESGDPDQDPAEEVHAKHGSQTQEDAVLEIELENKEYFEKHMHHPSRENEMLKREMEVKNKIIEDLKLKLESARHTIVEMQAKVYNTSNSCDGADSGMERTTLQKVRDWRLEYEKQSNKPKVLGEGAFGTVYEGRCNTTERKVAVKAMKQLDIKCSEKLFEQIKSNIFSEIAMLSSLEHDNVICYHCVSYRQHPVLMHKEKYIFVVTELMEGGSLRQYVHNRPDGLGKDIEKLKCYTRQILEGVCYLHKHNPVIIHRDIKGGNILMNEDFTCIKLADFGCAKEELSRQDDGTVLTSTLYGTAAWAAPEVLRGKTARSESDIWSVAATVIEMFTGKSPFSGEFSSALEIIWEVGSPQIMYNPMKTKVIQQSISSNSMPVDLQSFLSACFKFEASERPSAAQLLDYSFCKVEQ